MARTRNRLVAFITAATCALTMSSGVAIAALPAQPAAALQSDTEWRTSWTQSQQRASTSKFEYQSVRMISGTPTESGKAAFTVTASNGSDPDNSQDPALRVTAKAPLLEFSNPRSQELYGAAYQSALKNLLESNTVSFDPETYNKSGLMDLELGKFIRAGGSYDQPWSRDASINAWNAASLLSPDVARNTLWAVADKDGAGNLRLQQDTQTWDHVVWVTAAWNHYLVTGDTEFLQSAYETAKNTIAIRESAAKHTVNPTYGLFNGPSFFNDGIAGYSADAIGGSESKGSGSYGYDGVNASMHLSTNALYYAAYVNVANMARELGESSAIITGYTVKATALKNAINKHLWNEDTGFYRYGLLEDGTPDNHQEGAGLAFAIMFGIADAGKAQSILQNATTMEWGVPDVYPNYERYSEAKPGRHNAIVWPLVQGLWAKAVTQAGDSDAFAFEATSLARMANANSGFWEIYNGTTGVVDGGWQTGGHWDSVTVQAWSASAFLDMIYADLFGMNVSESELQFSPTLPMGWGDVTLRELRYRNSYLTVSISGAGSEVQSVHIDGIPVDNAVVPATLNGDHTVEIVLTGADEDADRDGDGIRDMADSCPDVLGSPDYRGCPSPEKIEAEDAINTGGVRTTDRNGKDPHTGYSGRAFAEGVWSVGASSSYTLHRNTAADTTGTITIGYASGFNEARTISLYVDGQKFRQLALPSSGGWDSWSTYRVEDVPLTGSSPIVSLVYDNSDLGRVNLDWLGADIAPVAVTPAPVTFDHEGATYTVPSTDGVEYLVDGEVVAAGTYPGSGTVTVTARVLAGVTLSVGATSGWTHRFSPMVVNPVAPSYENGLLSITSVEGVTYEVRVDGVLIGVGNGSVELSPGSTAVVTAVPDSGYIFPDGIQISWTFENTMVDPELKVSRLSGSTRYATNLAVNVESMRVGKPVFVATGANFADALSVSPAVALLDGSLVLTSKSKIDDGLLALIKGKSPSAIYVIGGTGAISDAVVSQLRSATGVSPERVSGSSRYETSQMVLTKFFAGREITGAFIATGRSFPDALVASAAGGALSMPVVLVDGKKTTSLPVSVSQFLGAKLKNIQIVGGTGAVNAALERNLSSRFEVDRLSGPNRYATGLAVNAYIDSQVSGVDVVGVWLATGTNFPDALSASVPAGDVSQRLVLSNKNCIPKPVVSGWIKGAASKVTKVTLVGGTGALSDKVLNLTECD